MFSPCVGDGSYEVELVEAEAEVQLPEAGGEQRPGEVAPDEAGGRVLVPGGGGERRLVGVEGAGLRQVVAQHHAGAVCRGQGSHSRTGDRGYSLGSRWQVVTSIILWLFLSIPKPMATKYYIVEDGLEKKE